MAAESAIKHFAASSVLHESQHIACYLAQDKEFDTQPFIQMVWSLKKLCYLPVISPMENGLLEFGLFEEMTELRPNKYKIPEPVVTSYFPKQELDIVLMPLVGFDLSGNRLGMGGGYYDKTFKFLLSQKPTKPKLIGLAFEAQKMTEIPTESWDIPLDAVVTEKKIYFFK